MRCVNCNGEFKKLRVRGLCSKCYREARQKKNLSDFPKLTESLTKQKLQSLYFEEKKSLQDIAEQYGCTRARIQQLMDVYGLERRKRSRARVEAIKKGKFENFEHREINDIFFSEWSPQMAWVLGLLFTDGYIMQRGKGLRVILSSVDIELLEKVRKCLDSTFPIRKRAQSYDTSRHIYTFEFYREKIREDLFKLGLRQKKSLTMRFPDIPKQFVRHFIRGCWDGDGSFTRDKKSGKINAKYICGSIEFIKPLLPIEWANMSCFSYRLQHAGKDLEA